MANFDIEYSQRLPPAVGPNVMGSPNVSTGAEMIGAAIQGFGDVFARMNQAWEATELSTMKSRYDKLSFDALNLYSTTGDPTARANITAKWSKDVEGLSAQSKSNSVNRQFRMHLNDTLPQWAQSFAEKEIVMRRREIADETQINMATQLERGDKSGYADSVALLLSENMISQAKAEDLLDNFDKDTTLSQARKLIGGGAFDTAIESLSALEGLSSEQLDLRDKLLRMARESQTDTGDTLQKNILRQLVQADAANLDPISRGKLVADMKLQVTDPKNGLSGEQSRVMLNWLDSWAATAPVETDWASYETVRKLVAPIGSGRLKLDDALSIYRKELPKLGKQERKELLEKLISASEAKPDDPLNDPVYTRGLQTVTKWETDGWLIPNDATLKKELSEEEYETYTKLKDTDQKVYLKAYSAKSWRDFSNKYEAWYKESPRTAKEVEEYLDQIIKLPKTDAAKKWLGWRAWDWLGENPPSVLLGIRKGSKAEPQVGPVQPRPLDLATAKKYLFLAGGDRARAEQMAKQDGYTW